ncbi:hypothetical protein BFF78_03350 [Streptomyces fodineus]|uniref:Uncharacterized protein n=1 Tax=Streptomyces fodineus TaxID=1904616 RepID=A0A1D7Y3S4_9ACTN|nr:hypothetical protein BFF78_03350 [Streptomyces fodineus]
MRPADDFTAGAFAGTVGLAVEVVRQRRPGSRPRSAGTSRRPCGGLAVLPLLAGYGLTSPGGGRGRVFGHDAAGGLYEKRGFYSEDSGSP